MTNRKETHIIYFKSNESGDYSTQLAYGKDDLFSTIRQKMKDGYTTFKIVTIKN